MSHVAAPSDKFTVRYNIIKDTVDFRLPVRRPWATALKEECNKNAALLRAGFTWDEETEFPIGEFACRAVLGKAMDDPLTKVPLLQNTSFGPNMFPRRFILPRRPDGYVSSRWIWQPH
jgi:hypothetical protein